MNIVFSPKLTPFLAEGFSLRIFNPDFMPYLAEVFFFQF